MEFIDLKAQYRALQPAIDAGIRKVLESTRFIGGGEVKELEERLASFVGRKHCVSCANGTEALQLAFMAYGIEAGDAVFCPDMTFISSVEPAVMLGAKPVFCDIDPDTYNLDPASLEKQIEAVEREGKYRPRFVVAVDFLGNPADFDAISSICRAHGLVLIEDAAQGTGASRNGRKCGSFGDIATTSFFPSKPLGCYGDGGAVFTDDDDLYDKMYSILVHGRSAEDRYNNVRLGLNARCDTIQAAVLLAKLKLFPGEVEMRQVVADRYRAGLKGLVSVQTIPEGCVSVYAQFCPRSPKFAEIQAALKAADVPTARYYPIPMHLLGATEYLGYKKGDMPVSEACAADIFALPMHPYLKAEDIDRICGVIADTVKA